jgi:nitroimidazol reductase NimA-like FMN-containing flavoprotein (pyridoxamine 5'-phosphate oxidase superfamily)
VSNPPEVRKVRRADKLMSEARMHEMLATAYSGHLGTVGPDGSPYVCPLLYVWLDGRIWMHNARGGGHLLSNVKHEPRACFEVDVPGEVFAYGRFVCDTSIEYRSIVAFGRLDIIDDAAQKTEFFDALMAKYFNDDPDRPRGFYPRLDDVTVYAMRVERMTGKETQLPARQDQWPAADNTKSPKARPPQI